MLLDPLEHEIAERLAAAGDRARSSSSTPPDRAFSADLRDRLMRAAAEREALPDRERGPRLAWALPSLFRIPRLLPVAVASLLLIAGLVAARELYVAIGNRDKATPTPAPSVAVVVPLESASLAPASDAPSAAASVEATATPKPSAKPTTKPTAAPTPGIVAMSLAATGCDGGVVLDWSAYSGDWFNHYTTLRNTTNSVPKAYPPQGGAVDPGGTYTTNVGKTSAVDVSAAPGTTYYYRTMAFKADNSVIGASSVVSAVADSIASLGSLGVAPDAVDGTDVSWTPYSGPGDCFTWYKLVYSETNPSPSYLDGDPHLLIGSDQSTASYVAASSDLQSGHTYYLRVQVIRGTDVGAFMVAQSLVVNYPVP
jgi:hypothetical protein